MKIIICTNYNPTIGSGHLMRCLSLASAARKLGAQVLFLIDSDYGSTIIKDQEFEFSIVSNQNQIENTQDIIRIYNPDVTIVDSYSVTERYLIELKKYTKLAYIDDLYMFEYPVDILINYSIAFKEFSYTMDCKYIVGPKYVPLREEFVGIHEKDISNNIQKIMVTTGATDSLNFCNALVESAALTNHYMFNIVVGKFFNKEKLVQLAKTKSNIRLHFDVKSMSSLMVDNDICVSASGSTIYELCACGLPIISFSFADNQLPGVNALQAENLILYAGDARCGMKKVVDNVNKLIMKLDDCNVRRNISLKQQEIIDGKGAERIIKEIIGT